MTDPRTRVNGWRLQLNWNRHFTKRNQVPDGEDADTRAYTKCPIRFSWNPKQSGSNHVLTWSIDVKLDTRNSWVLRRFAETDDRESRETLKHEQGHYDISSLYALELSYEFDKLSAAKVADLTTLVNATARSVLTKAKNTQDQYETDTDHGRKAAIQEQWNKLFLESRQQAEQGTFRKLPDHITFSVPTQPEIIDPPLERRPTVIP